MIARWLAASLFFLLLVVAWYLAVEAHIWSPLLLPSPLSVFGYLRSAAEDGTRLFAVFHQRGQRAFQRQTGADQAGQAHGLRPRRLQLDARPGRRRDGNAAEQPAVEATFGEDPPQDDEE